MDPQPYLRQVDDGYVPGLPAARFRTMPEVALAISGDADAVRYFYTGLRWTPKSFSDKGSTDSPEDEQLYEVRIIDNNYNTYREVMDVSMLALAVSEDEAYQIAWEVDHYGSCVVAHAALAEAEALAGLIRTIGIEVQVNPIAVPH